MSLNPKLEQYMDLLQHFNESSNLIGPMDRATIQRDLIEDSLKSAQHVAPSGRALDVGSGAGLPGLPLAIIYPDAHFTLVEPRKKRTQFLRIATNRLGLKDRVQVIEERIETVTLDPDFECFDWVVSKAFTSPPLFLKQALEWVRPGGHIISMISAQDWAELQDVAKELPVDRVGLDASTTRMVVTWMAR